MNWSDEHYVKLYTRDSLTWRSWQWEARTVFLHLIRKVDHSGFIETGRMSIVDALVLQLDLPKAVVEPGMAALIGSGTAEAVDGAVLLTKFNEAQEARKTDAQKKRDERSRNIANRRERMSPAVTASHPASPAVTQTDPPAQPSPAQPRNTVTEVKPPSPPERIFEHWKKATGKTKAKADPKRLRLIQARLDEGYTEDDLRASIGWYAKSPFHCGENDRHKKYLGLDLMLRDAAHVDAGLDGIPAPSTVVKTTPDPLPEAYR